MTAVGLVMVSGGILVAWAGLTGASIGETLGSILQGKAVKRPSGVAPSPTGPLVLSPTGGVGHTADINPAQNEGWGGGTF